VGGYGRATDIMADRKQSGAVTNRKGAGQNIALKSTAQGPTSSYQAPPSTILPLPNSPCKF
jgi:hypothetical protein